MAGSKFKPLFETHALRVLVLTELPEIVLAELYSMGFEVIVYGRGLSQSPEDAPMLTAQADYVITAFPGDTVSAMLAGMALSNGKTVFAYLPSPPSVPADVVYKGLTFVTLAQMMQRLSKETRKPAYWLDQLVQASQEVSKIQKAPVEELAKKLYSGWNERRGG